MLSQFRVPMCLIFATWMSGITLVNAQQAADAIPGGETERRLKGIYEQGEFRAKPFEVTWWADSTGYSVRKRDSQTGETVIAHFDVHTGAETNREPPSEERNSRDSNSPDGKLRIRSERANLAVVNLETNQRTPLINPDEKREVWYRDPIWSSNSRFVAFKETDETDVKKRTMLVPSDPSYPGVREQRFARVGEKITSLRVGIADVEEGNVCWLPIESPDEGFYLGQVAWAGEELLIERLSRFRDTREFFLTSHDGRMRRIYRETNSAWAIGSQGLSLGLKWIRGGEAFVVVSEKDGWRHAFLYTREGKEQCVLTPGEYDIIDKAALDEEGGWYYFFASPDNGTEKYLYRVPLDGSGKLERITPVEQRGTHDYDFSPDAKFAFHTWSTFDTPPVVELVELAGHRVVQIVEENDKLRRRAKDAVHHPTDFMELNIGDGVTLDAWMIKPEEFDESKKYPLFIYVYGEPYSQTVLNQWGAGQSHFLRVIADLGYLVVSIDNRGTPAPKGAAWRRSIFGSLGPLSTKEQAAGLKELARMRPFVDLSRVGIWGWSGGGSNTLNAMFRRPDDYHVGIAVVPKPQPHLYNAWFQEIYMRTREVNADGYKESAPINFAEGLKGKLLIITGSGETNTHIQIIEGLVDRLIELGKPFDYMVYPNRDHGLRKGPGTVVHVRMLIARYLLSHLPPGPM